MAEFSLTSSAFAAGGTIPRRHACDGEDRSAATVVVGTAYRDPFTAADPG